MDKLQLIEFIKDKKYTHEQLLGWVNSLPGGTIDRSPIVYNRGDVLTHPVFKHPYILLKKRKDNWLCTLLTSDPNCNEMLEECNSRFFKDNYVTKVLFTTTIVVGKFINMYDNNKQLSHITKQLQTILNK